MTLEVTDPSGLKNNFRMLASTFVRSLRLAGALNQNPLENGVPLWILNRNGTDYLLPCIYLCEFVMGSVAQNLLNLESFLSGKCVRSDFH